MSDSTAKVHPEFRLGRLRSWLVTLFGFSWPVKILVGFLVSAIAGPGALSIASEYATYRYALDEGIRVPAEGVSYLAATVFALGFFLALAFGLIFATVWLVAFTMQHAAMRFTRKDRFSSKGRRNSMGAYAIVTLIGFSLILSFEGRYGWPEIPLGLYGRFLLAVHILMSVSVLYILFKRGVLWSAALFATSVYPLALVLMFTPAVYARFLRVLGFGGGVSVQVDFGERGELQESGQLLIRTRESVLLRIDNADSAVVEVPMTAVKRIRYR